MHRQAQRVAAACIRGRVVIKWAKHLQHKFVRRLTGLEEGVVPPLDTNVSPRERARLYAAYARLDDQVPDSLVHAAIRADSDE